MALSLALGGVKLIQPSSGGSRRPLHFFTRFLHENPNRYQTCAVIPKSHDFSLTSFRHYQNSIHLTPPPHALLTLSRDDPRRRWFASTSSSSSSSEKPPKIIRDDSSSTSTFARVKAALVDHSVVFVLFFAFSGIVFFIVLFAMAAAGVDFSGAFAFAGVDLREEAAFFGLAREEAVGVAANTASGKNSAFLVARAVHKLFSFLWLYAALLSTPLLVVWCRRNGRLLRVKERFKNIFMTNA